MRLTHHGGPARSALRSCDVLMQIATAVNAIEELSPNGVRHRSVYLPYRVVRIRHPRCLRGRRVSQLFSPARESAASALKLVAAATLLVSDSKSAIGRLARLAEVTTHLFHHMRVAGLGQDGSDHALTILHAAHTIAAFSKRGGAYEVAALHFIAAQGVLSYVVSGVAKLFSPVWRSGAAMPSILRATSYGDPALHRMMQSYPVIARLLAWATIVGEVSAPIALITPTPVRVLWHALMITMHVVIGRYMGLNRFMWAFVAMHPAMSFTASEIHSAVHARAATPAPRRTRTR